MIRVAQPRLQRGKQLPDDDDRRIAHIVVHVAQPKINRCLVRHRRNHDVVAVLPHGRAEEVKVDRRHLRRKNRMRLSAVLGKARTLDDGHLVIDGVLPARKRCNQRTQTDACRAEIRHLVEFDHRIDTLVRFEDLAHLGGR